MSSALSMHLSTLFMLQQAIYKTSKHKDNHSFIFRPFYAAVSIAEYILARSTLLFFINRFRSGYISSPNAPSITYMIKRCISNMTVYFSNKYISITNTTQMHFRSVALHKNKHNAKITYIDVLTFFSVWAWVSILWPIQFVVWVHLLFSYSKYCHIGKIIKTLNHLSIDSPYAIAKEFVHSHFGDQRTSYSIFSLS